MKKSRVKDISTCKHFLKYIVISEHNVTKIQFYYCYLQYLSCLEMRFIFTTTTTYITYIVICQQVVYQQKVNIFGPNNDCIFLKQVKIMNI